MKPILVLSIAHCGTFSALNMMPGRRGAWPGPFEEDRKYFCHLRDPFAITAIEQCFTVVPLRNYADVVESWRRDKLDLDELYSQWHEMMDLKNVYHLNLDSEVQREFQIRKISAALGVEITPDWTAYHSMKPPV